MNVKRKNTHYEPLDGDVANKKMKWRLTWKPNGKNTIYLQMMNSVHLLEAFIVYGYGLWMYD